MPRDGRALKEYNIRQRWAEGQPSDVLLPPEPPMAMPHRHRWDLPTPDGRAWIVGTCLDCMARRWFRASEPGGKMSKADWDDLA